MNTGLYPDGFNTLLKNNLSPFASLPTQLSCADDGTQQLKRLLHQDELQTFYAMFEQVGGNIALISKADYAKALWGFFAYTLNPFACGYYNREDGGHWNSRNEVLKAFTAWLIQEPHFSAHDASLIFVSVDNVEPYT